MSWEWLKRRGIEYRKLKNLICELREDKAFNKRYELAYLKYCENKKLSFDDKIDMHIWAINCSILNIKMQRKCKLLINNRTYIRNIKQQLDFIQDELNDCR